MTVSIDNILAQTASSTMSALGTEDTPYQLKTGPTGSIEAHVEYVTDDKPGIKSIPKVYVTLYNSATKGFALNSIDTGGDMLYVPAMLGQPRAWKRITKIIAADSGLITVEVK